MPCGWSSPVALEAQERYQPAADAAAQRAVLDRYCVGCHNERTKDSYAGLALDSVDLSDAGAHAVALEKLVRLNRAEYRNAVRDLLAIDVDVAALLPADDASYGFDNIAGVLRISQSQLEQYLAAARKISREALGSPLPATAVKEYRVAETQPQYEHLDGLPFGTRGGLRVPVTGGSHEISVAFLKLPSIREAGGHFEAGIEAALRRLLVSPEFLFRVERDPDGIAADTNYRISDLELATRAAACIPAAAAAGSTACARNAPRARTSRPARPSTSSPPTRWGVRRRSRRCNWPWSRTS